MFYLRKEPYEKIVKPWVTGDGRVVPEEKYMTDDLAIYKHPRFSRFYRGYFSGIDGRHQGMKVYRCKTLKRIVELRKSTFDYCGEWFDVYDENGIVHGKWEHMPEPLNEENDDAKTD